MPPASFEHFYCEELAGQVRRAYLILGSAETAEDAVHDAFVELYRRWGTLDDPGPYLATAVLNRCRDLQRRQAGYLRLLPRLREAAESPDAPETLEDVLMRLPFNQRAALVLRYYVGMTTEEVAVTLGASPGSVGPWIARGLKAMRKALP